MPEAPTTGLATSPGWVRTMHQALAPQPTDPRDVASHSLTACPSRLAVFVFDAEAEVAFVALWFAAARVERRR